MHIFFFFVSCVSFSHFISSESTLLDLLSKTGSQTFKHLRVCYFTNFNYFLTHPLRITYRHVFIGSLLSLSLVSPKTVSFLCPLKAEAGQYKRQLSEQSDQLKEAQLNAQQQDQRVRELQRLMGSMKDESSSLRDELMTRESELLRLRELKDEGHADKQRQVKPQVKSRRL